jgi:2-polyprenyl-6-methoxyphenol hydroxylase-like FAD-dependent oxidoreductase
VPVRLDRLPTEYPYTLMVPQNVTEQVLLDRLEELDGQGPPSLRRHTGLSETADGAEVTLDSGDKIKAQYVAAADGMNRCERGPAGCVRGCHSRSRTGSAASRVPRREAQQRLHAACILKRSGATCGRPIP